MEVSTALDGDADGGGQGSTTTSSATTGLTVDNATATNTAIGGLLFVSLGSPAAPSTTAVHASYAGNTADTAAELDLGGLAAGDLDTIVEATTAGLAGNSITVQATGDSAPAGGVSIVVAGTAVHIHYESGVSTVGDVESAITALAGGDDIIGVGTGGTGATVLTAPADDFAATALAGGLDHENFPGAFTSPVVPRNLTVTFAAGWDGGNVVVTGTDPADAALNETFTASAGNTVTGVKPFKTVTSATKAAEGASGDGASIGTGNKLWISGATMTQKIGLLSVDGVTEAATWDTTYNAVTPSTAPNGSRVFLAAPWGSVPVTQAAHNHAVTDAGHTHS